MSRLADIFTAEEIHHGFGKFDDLGVGVNYDLYDRNIERANAENRQPCTHCGRGLNLDTCYLAIYAFGRQAFIAADVEYDALMSFADGSLVNGRPTGRLGWSWVFLGSECAKNLPARFRIRYTEFPASKWYDTPAHHDTEWGTW